MATTKNIQSVERAFSILELFSRSGCAEQSVKEIADGLELNKSTAFGLINTLTNLGYLQQNAENQKYALGLKLLSLSDAVKAQNLIIRAVHPYLEQINRRYGETAHCAVQENDGVIYVDKVESSGAIYIGTRIGTRNDLHCTGVGKCILAYMPPKDQERVFSRRMRVMTPNTIHTAEQLRRAIAEVRRSGYATDNEEIAEGLFCVAVPVFSAPETVACAISVSGMTPRIQAAREGGLLDDLKQAAADISREVFRYDPAANGQG
ncbi:MAG: IclR family transcriptional regulator [Ruminococcaceae bacterium]|nr:IclR family transcriptional regulator [Oscillospiraceae bacterium]